MNATAKNLYNRSQEELLKEVDRIKANRSIWDQFLVTDTKYTKTFKKAGGFSGTSIAPMYSVQRMTEVFGPAGTGWGYDFISEKVVVAEPLQTVFICGRVWYKDENGETHYTPPSYGGESLVTVSKEGQIRIDDEAFKKATTDSMTKCFSYLGVGSDVHMGRHDDKNSLQIVNQYTADRETALKSVRAQKRKQEREQQSVVENQDVVETAQEIDAVETPALDLSLVPPQLLARINNASLDSLPTAENYIRNVMKLNGQALEAALSAIATRRAELSA